MNIQGPHKPILKPKPFLTPYMQAKAHPLPTDIHADSDLIGQWQPGDRVLVAQSPALDDHTMDDHDLILIAVHISRRAGLEESNRFITRLIRQSDFEYRSGLELKQNGIVAFKIEEFPAHRFSNGARRLVELDHEKHINGWHESLVAFDPQVFQLCPA